MFCAWDTFLSPSVRYQSLQKILLTIPCEISSINWHMGRDSRGEGHPVWSWDGVKSGFIEVSSVLKLQKLGVVIYELLTNFHLLSFHVVFFPPRSSKAVCCRAALPCWYMAVSEAVRVLILTVTELCAWIQEPPKDLQGAGNLLCPNPASPAGSEPSFVQINLTTFRKSWARNVVEDWRGIGDDVILHHFFPDFYTLLQKFWFASFFDYVQLSAFRKEQTMVVFFFPPLCIFELYVNTNASTFHSFIVESYKFRHGKKGTELSKVLHIYWLNIHYSRDYITHTLHTKRSK